MDAQYSISDLKKSFAKNAGEVDLPEPQAVIVFTNPKATVDVTDAPTPAVGIDKLKDYIRKQTKVTPEVLDSIKKLQKALPSENTSE
jgi:hypothetical protein